MSPLLDMSGLIEVFNVGPLNVERRAPPTQNVFGGFTDATAESVSIDPVAVHNLTGRDLEQVPEADGHSEVLQLYTRVRLYVSDEGRVADVITNYRGRRWRVVRVQDYELQGDVYIAFAVLEDV